MPGADGKGTVKAFCCQSLAGKATLLAIRERITRLSPAMIAKANGFPGQ